MKKIIKSLLFLFFVIFVSYNLNFGPLGVLVFSLSAYLLYKIPFFLKRYFSKKLEEIKEEKEFQKQLRRQAQTKEVLGKAENKAHIELVNAQTQALIKQMKAGVQVQNELKEKYKEITALGDTTFNDMKKEIEKMSVDPKTNFNL